jgi:7-carboxy-7-deazaguanine synthase
LECEIEAFVETNGAVSIAPFKLLAHMVMDIKCPSSGMHEKMDWSNVAMIGPRDDVKFVIADEEDYEYAMRVISERRLMERTANVFLSPVWRIHELADGGVEFFQQLSQWMIRDRCPAKLSLQQHKVIWGPVKRGV